MYWSLSFWLTSLCIMGSSFIHLIRTDSNAFFLIAESYSIVYHSFLIHSSANGHLGCFHVLAVVNSAALWWTYMCLFQFWFRIGFSISAKKVSLAVWKGGESGGTTDTCIGIAESLCHSLEIITALLICNTDLDFDRNFIESVDWFR